MSDDPNPNLNLRQFSVHNDAYLGGPGKAAEVGGWYPSTTWANVPGIREHNKDEAVKRMGKAKAEWLHEDDVYDYEDSWNPDTDKYDPRGLN